MPGLTQLGNNQQIPNHNQQGINPQVMDPIQHQNIPQAKNATGTKSLKDTIGIGEHVVTNRFGAQQKNTQPATNFNQQNSNPSMPDPIQLGNNQQIPNHNQQGI